MAARALGGAKRPMPRNNAAGANELTREAEHGTTSSRGESSRMARSALTPAREVSHTDTTLGRPIQAILKYETWPRPGLSLW